MLQLRVFVPPPAISDVAECLKEIPGSRHVIRTRDGASDYALVTADLIEDAVDTALDQVKRSRSAADNVLADFEGKPHKDFVYKDKGIMAMIGRGAAVAELGKHHHEVHGQLAHMAWLGVHASLTTGGREKIEALID